MAVVYNVTFIVAPSEEHKLEEWLKARAKEMLQESGHDDETLWLQKVVEVGGEKPAPEHGVSIALQHSFPDEKSAHEWHDNILPQILGDFNCEFRPQCAFFITLLERIGL